MSKIDAPRGARILRGRLERGGELGPLRLEQLAGLRAIERRERAGDVRVAQVDRREHDRPRLERAPRLGALFARGLHAGLAELVAQDDGLRRSSRWSPWRRRPAPRRSARAASRCTATRSSAPALSTSPPPPTASRIHTSSAARWRCASWRSASGPSMHGEVVERAGAALVAAHGELARGGAGSRRGPRRRTWPACASCARTR